MSLGKTSQFTRHTTTIKVNPSQTCDDTVSSIEINGPSNVDVVQKKKDILDEMQHHLKQMEQELAIVSEASVVTASQWQNGIQNTVNSGPYSNNTIRFESKNCPIVETDLFRRCESEEQLLDAPGYIGKILLMKDI